MAGAGGPSPRGHSCVRRCSALTGSCALSPFARTQVDAAKQETAEALVALERERHKLSVLEVEVRRQFEAHCRSFEAKLRYKASKAVAMWRGIAMQAATSVPTSAAVAVLSADAAAPHTHSPAAEPVSAVALPSPPPPPPAPADQRLPPVGVSASPLTTAIIAQHAAETTATAAAVSPMAAASVTQRAESPVEDDVVDSLVQLMTEEEREQWFALQAHKQ